MKLPSRKQCVNWLLEQKMPKNIIEHSLKVEQVAVFIAKKLKEKGEKIDVDLVSRASIIHDIDKHLTLKTGDHGTKGKQILLEKNEPILAEFCVTHLLTFVLKNEFSSAEHKIVFYADKRVLGDKIVSLDKRFDYLLKRYGSKSKTVFERILASKPIVEKMEKKIFEQISVSKKLSELNERTGSKTKTF
jgi:uncharacterized protein